MFHFCELAEAGERDGFVVNEGVIPEMTVTHQAFLTLKGSQSLDMQVVNVCMKLQLQNHRRSGNPGKFLVLPIDLYHAMLGSPGSVAAYSTAAYRFAHCDEMIFKIGRGFSRENNLRILS